MQYIDLQPFEDFMCNRSLVDSKHRSYYLNWVLRFLRAEFDRDKLANLDLLQCYSDQLARDSTLEDWQRRQAMKAVELYLNVYLPEANRGGEEPRIAGFQPASENSGQDKAGGTPAVQENEQDALREMKRGEGSGLNIQHWRGGMILFSWLYGQTCTS